MELSPIRIEIDKTAYTIHLLYDAIRQHDSFENVKELADSLTVLPDELLYFAVSCKACIKIIKYLLIRGLNPNKRGPSNPIIFHYVDDIELASLLISYGADPNPYDLDVKHNAIEIAYIKQNKEMCLFYLDYFDHLDSRIRDFLMDSYEYDLNVVKKIVKIRNWNQECDFLCDVDIIHNHELIEFFLNNGLDPNAFIRGHYGKLLERAVQVSCFQTVKILLKYGADQTLSSLYLNKPIYHAFFISENNEILNLLIESLTSDQLARELYLIFRENNVKMSIRDFFDVKHEILFKKLNTNPLIAGDTLLHLACELDIPYLVDHMAPFGHTQRDYMGRTPLHRANELYDIQHMAKFNDINAIDNDGETFMHRKNLDKTQLRCALRLNGSPLLRSNNGELPIEIHKHKLPNEYAFYTFISNGRVSTNLSADLMNHILEFVSWDWHITDVDIKALKFSIN